MTSSLQSHNKGLPKGSLSRIHHISLKVTNMKISKHFYGNILGLQELTNSTFPESISRLVKAEKIAIFYIPDGSLVNLFLEPDLALHSSSYPQSFTHAEISNHLAFEIDSQRFEQAVEVMYTNNVKFDYGINGSTGKALYCYDPDGFLIEIRYDYLRLPQPNNLT